MTTMAHNQGRSRRASPPWPMSAICAIMALGFLHSVAAAAPPQHVDPHVADTHTVVVRLPETRLGAGAASGGGDNNTGLVVETVCNIVGTCEPCQDMDTEACMTTGSHEPLGWCSPPKRVTSLTTEPTIVVHSLDHDADDGEMNPVSKTESTTNTTTTMIMTWEELSGYFKMPRWHACRLSTPSSSSLSGSDTGATSLRDSVLAANPVVIIRTGPGHPPPPKPRQLQSGQPPSVPPPTPSGTVTPPDQSQQQPQQKQADQNGMPPTDPDEANLPQVWRLIRFEMLNLVGLVASGSVILMRQRRSRSGQYAALRNMV